ncbi:MAG: hypothetical protein JNL38_03470, partial [Myxococcales bacterium]|nr:hypothetical protein [Myxococcales bacterium]
LFAALGVATDRIFFPSVGGRAPSPEVTPPAPAPPGRAIVTPALAREVVAAAWRAASLPASDARLESVVRRARWSAALPEARLRVAQSVDDRMSLGGEVGDDTPRAYSMQGTRSSYEARLTWRLDRLVFADEEPAVERMRHDQELTRLRIAGQVLEALFAWQRAVIDAREASRADPSSREALDAGVRVAEADALLDVLTGGFWGHRRP